jgi:hypothetical protein
LGPSVGKVAITAASETSASSSSEVNSPVSIKPMKSKGNTVEELDEIMENLDLEESSDYLDTASDENLNNNSKENFITCYSDVSGNSKDTWRSVLKLHDNKQTTLYSDPSQYVGNRH